LFLSYDPLRDVRTAVTVGDGKVIDHFGTAPDAGEFHWTKQSAVRTNQVIITNDYQTETLGHPAVLVGP